MIFERARFNRRVQKEGEMAEQYIAALYNLADNCNFRHFKEEMIRDRLVAGIRDGALSERLQTDDNLTLEKAKIAIRQREAVKEQAKTLKGSKENPVLIESLHQRSGQAGGSAGGAGRQWQQRRSRGYTAKRGKHLHASNKRCGRWGKGHGKEETCPAKDATCHKCHLKGHYSAQCFSKRVALHSTSVQSASEEEMDDEAAYLDEVGAGEQSAWCAKIHVNDYSCDFKLDTGAEVTAVTEDLYLQLGKPELKQASKIRATAAGCAGGSSEVQGGFH